MTKKNWIYIKRGLSEDSKHRDAMGVRIWLFMHIIDRADWETGIVYEWRDRDESHDMNLPWRTMQKQRQELEELGYITCEKKQHGQNIIIHNWIDPRNYGGKILNIRLSTQNSVLSDFESTPQSTPQSTQTSYADLGTPTSSSLIIDHRSESKPAKASDPLLTHPAVVAYRDVMHLTPNQVQRQLIADRVGANGHLDDWRAVLTDWKAHSWKPGNIPGQLEKFAERIGVQHGHTQPTHPAGNNQTVEPTAAQQAAADRINAARAERAKR